MAELTIYEMKHGDSLLLKNKEEEGLLIDCGSNRNILPSVINTISSDLLSLNKKSVLFSHFHNDHINKIQLLDRKIKFNNVYLPNIINYHDIIVAFFILKYRSRSSKDYGLAYNYLTIIPKIQDYLNPNSKIYYLSKGAKINLSFTKFDVLWPDFNHFKDKIDYSNEINEYRFSDNELTIINNYYSLYKKINIFDNFATLEIADYYDFSNSVMKLVREFLNIRKKYKVEVNQKLLTKKAKELGDSVSLVMKDDIALFTGDITTELFDKYIESMIPKHIKILKTPHHGSKSHYSRYLPKATYAIITEFADCKHIDYLNYYFSGHYTNLIISYPLNPSSYVVRLGISLVNQSSTIIY